MSRGGKGVADLPHHEGGRNSPDFGKAGGEKKRVSSRGFGRAGPARAGAESRPMRIVQALSWDPPKATDFGSRRVSVLWDDGSRTTEKLSQLVPEHRTRQFLEKRKGMKVRAWTPLE